MMAAERPDKVLQRALEEAQNKRRSALGENARAHRRVLAAQDEVKNAENKLAHAQQKFTEFGDTSYSKQRRRQLRPRMLAAVEEATRLVRVAKDNLAQARKVHRDAYTRLTHAENAVLNCKNRIEFVTPGVVPFQEDEKKTGEIAADVPYYETVLAEFTKLFSSIRKPFEEVVAKFKLELEKLKKLRCKRSRKRALIVAKQEELAVAKKNLEMVSDKKLTDIFSAARWKKTLRYVMVKVDGHDTTMKTIGKVERKCKLIFKAYFKTLETYEVEDRLLLAEFIADVDAAQDLVDSFDEELARETVRVGELEQQIAEIPKDAEELHGNNCNPDDDPERYAAETAKLDKQREDARQYLVQSHELFMAGFARRKEKALETLALEQKGLEELKEENVVDAFCREHVSPFVQKWLDEHP